MNRNLAAWFLVLVFAGAAMGAAGSPTDALKAPLDRSVQVLKDPKYQTDDSALKIEQRDKIWDIVAGIFDFTEVSRRALARNWKSFSPEQQKDFVAVFSKMLGNIYVDRIQTGFSDQNKIPVDYSLKKKDNRWLVYDVKVEGVSLIKNYRTQFNDILRKEKPAQLIERLKDKVAEQETPASQS